MLILERKLKQKIVIGGNVVIEIVQIKGKSIRLGIKAPKNVKVLREELENEIGDLEGFKR